jgi:hypothetical protein
LSYQLTGDTIERLDLKDETTRASVLAVSTNEHLKERFATRRRV